MAIDPSLNIQSCELGDSEYAAGIYCFGGTGAMQKCLVKRNAGDGVGVAEGAEISMEGCEICGNGGNGIQVIKPF